MTAHLRHMARYLTSLLILLGAWEILALQLGPHLLPRPVPVLLAFGAALGSGEFWMHAGASSWRAGAAMVLGMGLAYPLGLLLGRKPKVDGFVAPLIFLTYPLPKIVLLPVFMILFGLGDTSKILLVALTVGYQILVVTRAAARGLDHKYFDAFRSLHGVSPQAPKRLNPARLRSWGLTLRHVLIPATLPDALTALKVAGGTAVAVLFMAESFATRTGLGFLIMDAWGRGDQRDMFIAILGMSFLGLGLHQCCAMLERFFCKWKSVQAGR